MAEYRKRKNSDTWHFCGNCTEYPKSDYVTHSGGGEPTSGEKCNECKGKKANNNCT